MKQKEQAYAILREDNGIEEIKDRVTVVKVVKTLEAAESEVHRLNRLNSEKGAAYWWQCTRLEFGTLPSHDK